MSAPDSAVTVLAHRIICKQPGRYIGWPTITRTPAGELLVAFSGDREAHVDPFGKTQLVRSSDHGVTWSPVFTINDTPLDDRDAGICLAPTGELLVSWFTYYRPQWHAPDAPAHWRSHYERVSPSDITTWSRDDKADADYGRRGHWLRRSLDLGKTWEAPIQVAPTAPHGPIVLNDGRLMFFGNLGYLRHQRQSVLVATVSDDAGATWRTVGSALMFVDDPSVTDGSFLYFAEPHVVQCRSGKLVCVTRSEWWGPARGKRVSQLWQMDSLDGGATWSPARQLPIKGKPPHLHRLADGRLLLTYGHRQPPFSQQAVLSSDDGATWSTAAPLMLRSDAPNGDLGYPATVQLADGTLITVYYQVDQPGEKPCLMMTHWQLGQG